MSDWMVILIIVAVATAAGTAFLLYSRARRGAAHMMERLEGFLRIQRNAMKNFSSGSAAKAGQPMSEEEINQVSFMTSAGLSVAYTVTREAGAYVHHVSVQWLDHSEQEVTHETLLCVADLIRVYKACEIEADVWPKVGELTRSQLGTMHFEVTMTPAQHVSILQLVDRSDARQRIGAHEVQPAEITGLI